MKNVKTLALAVSMAAAATGSAFAADYSDGDIHKNDYKWGQFNLMYAQGQKPTGDNDKGHDYLELEFGGRSGVVDLYGYVDVFDLTGSNSGSKKDSDSKMYMKLAPRFSIDGMTGKDLSFGPVKEVYVATLFNFDGDVGLGKGVNNGNVGIGADVMVPWFGKVGMNLYAQYDIGQKDWNGSQFSVNWFKPFYNFDNGSFISYQGYIDYQFDMNSKASANEGGAMFNGIYWHSNRYSVGYGLKLFKDIYGIKDSSGLETSGVGHYFAATYKF